MKRRTPWRTFSALCLTVLLAVSFFAVRTAAAADKGGTASTRVGKSWRESGSVSGTVGEM